MVFLLGGLCGYWFSAELMYYINDNTSTHIKGSVIVIVAIVVGVLVGLALVYVIKVATFAVGAVGGVILAAFLMNIFDKKESLSPAAHIVLLVVAGIIGGFAALYLLTTCVKVITAFIGGYMFAAGADYFLGPAHLNKTKWDYLATHNFFKAKTNIHTAWSGMDAWGYVIISCWIALAIGGSIYQIKYDIIDNFGEEDDSLSSPFYGSKPTYDAENQYGHDQAYNY